MYISKPLQWKHLELSEKKIKNQQEGLAVFVNKINVPYEFSVKYSNLTILARPSQNKIISENGLPIYYYEIKNVCFLSHSCLLGQINFIFRFSSPPSPGADPGDAPGARPPKIGKNMIFWRKIAIFHTKYPKNFRASLRSAQFFLSPPP